MTKQEISQIIISAVEDFNADLDTPISLAEGEDSFLFGSGSPLSSVDFVSLVLDIEGAVENASGKAITIADARAMSQKNSPFRTVGSLAKYVEERLEGNE